MKQADTLHIFYIVFGIIIMMWTLFSVYKRIGSSRRKLLFRPLSLQTSCCMYCFSPIPNVEANSMAG